MGINGLPQFIEPTDQFDIQRLPFNSSRTTTLFHFSWMLRVEKTGIKHINQMQIDPTLIPAG
jgi:hypothetical protein